MSGMHLAAFAASFATLLLAIPAASSPFVLGEPGQAPRDQLTPRGCILIDGNAAFTSANGVVSGSGVSGDPYIIEKWRIPGDTPSPPCNPDDGFIYTVTKDIWIRDTDRHFVIRDVRTHGISIDFGHQGIMLDNVTHGRVENATVDLLVFEADITVGIQVQLSRNVTLMGNKVDQSVVLETSSDITVLDNEFRGTSLGIGNTVGAAVEGNRFRGGGIILRGTSVEHFTSHVIGPDNLANEKPVHYHKNCQGLDLIGVEAGQVLLANCTDVTVAGLTIEDTVIGIDLAFVRRARLSGNIVRNVTTGVSLDHAQDIVVAQNVVADGFFGFFIAEASHLTLLHNDIARSDVAGMFVFETDNVTVQGNNLSGNYPGLWLWGVDDVLVVQNNFLKNTFQAFTTATTDARWDAGYPGGGNHWSDYDGIDTCSGPSGEVCPNADGLGDTPYLVQVGLATDRYPLIRPYGPLNGAPTAHLDISLSGDESPRTVTLDASRSSDPEDPSVLLQVRWDWEGDGVWDTPWMTEKVTHQPHAELATGAVHLQVRDTRGLTNVTAAAIPGVAVPGILHVPVVEVVEQEPILITVTVNSAEELAEVLLHYRLGTSLEYTVVKMTQAEEGTYSAQIPAPVSQTEIHYYISAVDTRGGAARDPATGEHRIDVQAAGLPSRAPSLLAISLVGIAATVVLYVLVDGLRRRRG